MSLDDLLPLLFGVFFLVSLARRSSRNSRAPGRRPQVPTFGQGEQRAPRETSTEATPSTEASEQPAQREPKPPSAESPFDDMERRLLEAQRRVAESLRGERASATTTPSPTPQAPTGRGGPVSPPLLTGTQTVPQAGAGRSAANSPSPAPAGFLGREGGLSTVPRPQATAPGFLGREGPPRRAPAQPRSEARPTVQKRLPESDLLRFGEKDLVRAFIWRTVLDEPVGVKRLRRLQSQRR